MRHYLEGYHFVIITDHKSLKWLNSIQSLSGRIASWTLDMMQHDYKVKYPKGKHNVIADSLSRSPLPDAEQSPIVGIIKNIESVEDA